MATPAEPSTAAPPTDPEVVGSLIRDTLLEVWQGFLGHLPFLAVGVLALIATWAVARLFARFSHRLLANRGLRGSLKELIERLITLGIWSLGLLLTSMIVFPGLTPAKALGALGLASVAIGFAFKDIFENFFAGVLLLWRFPFERGDVIECGDLVGRVEQITIRMTQIRRLTGELVVVPNSHLFKNPVQVLTNPDKRRITVMAGIAYDEKIEEALPVIREAVEGCETVDADHEVEIFPQAFGASSIDIEVTWWTDPSPLALRRSRGEVVTAVKQALDAAGIEIPFPYR
ncbi:MAG: mechanosensitive ion channel family protein, partial [Myxococcales bacterium]|nr:mechanosensitive ion channel family protein [Myxococcales bacterium]